MTAKQHPNRPPPYFCIVCGEKLPPGRMQGRCESCAMPQRRADGWFIEPRQERPAGS